MCIHCLVPKETDHCHRLALDYQADNIAHCNLPLLFKTNTGILRDEARWWRVDAGVEAFPNAGACN